MLQTYYFQSILLQEETAVPPVAGSSQSRCFPWVSQQGNCWKSVGRVVEFLDFDECDHKIAQKLQSDPNSGKRKVLKTFLR